MALRSTATKEEIDEQSNPFTLALQSTALSSTAAKEEIDEQSNPFMLALQSTRTLDAAVKDAVRAPPTTIHSFDVFACLDVGERTERDGINQRPITVTLLRSSDGSTLASALAPCKRCFTGFSFWVDTPQALHQCVTRLMASNGVAGQRW
eukprot:5900949-Amphidinium_carterae.1